MKWMARLTGISAARYSDCPAPENLPGVKKKSFILPFGGGEIWFEHLDGMYQYTELVLRKLKQDSLVFLLPSKPSQIGFVLNETRITDAVVDEIVHLVCHGGKRYLRVCFIGADRYSRNRFCHALRHNCSFAFAFFDDFEQAKVWLVSE